MIVLTTPDAISISERHSKTSIFNEQKFILAEFKEDELGQLNEMVENGVLDFWWEVCPSQINSEKFWESHKDNDWTKKLIEGIHFTYNIGKYKNIAFAIGSICDSIGADPIGFWDNFHPKFSKSDIENMIDQGEPVFVLRGKDPFAPVTIKNYANRRYLVNSEGHSELMKLANKFFDWRERHKNNS